MHAVERAHVSTARACKLGLAGWGQRAGAAAAPRIHLMGLGVPQSTKASVL